MLLAALAIALSATAGSASRYSDCSQTKNVDLQIRGCTGILQRGKREQRKNRFQAYHNRGGAYLRTGKLDEAIADYTEAIAIGPKRAVTYYGRGSAYLQMGDLDHAIADFTKAISLRPEDLVAYYDRGLAYAKKGEVDRAIADLTKAEKLTSKKP